MYSRMSISTAARDRYYKRHFESYLQKNTWALILGVLYLIGVFVGVQIVLNSVANNDGIFSIFKGFMEMRSSQPIGDTVISSFLSTFYIVAILFVLGFCAISAPIIPLLPLFKGLGYGISAAVMLESAYSEKLIEMMLLMLPYATCTAIIVIIGAKFSLQMSLMCYQIFKDGAVKNTVSAGEYCRAFLVLVFLTGAFALMDGALYTYFAKSLFL